MNRKLVIGSIGAVLLVMFVVARHTPRDNSAPARAQPPQPEVPSGRTTDGKDTAEQGSAEITDSQDVNSDRDAAVTGTVQGTSDRTQREFLAANDEARRIVQNLIAADRDVRRHRVVELDRRAAWSLIAIARGDLPQLPVRYVDLPFFPDAPCTLNASFPRRVEEVRAGHWVVSTGCVEFGGLQGVQALYNEPEGRVTFTRSLPDGTGFRLIPLQGIYALAYETGPMLVGALDRDVGVVE